MTIGILFCDFADTLKNSFFGMKNLEFFDCLISNNYLFQSRLIFF